MIRSICATIALLAGTQFAAAVDSSYPAATTTTTVQAYTSSGAAVTQAPLDPLCPQMDGNDEVLLPPLLSEDDTRVVFTSGSEDMQVRLLIPKQYSTSTSRTRRPPSGSSTRRATRATLLPPAAFRGMNSAATSAALTRGATRTLSGTAPRSTSRPRSTST